MGYDARLDVAQHALGLHTAISRVQGGKLKAKKEIRVASLFKEAPADFLRMIVVHELAHLKESDHNKAFYRLCEHMEPRYHQLEFDTRLFLAWRELDKTGKTPRLRRPAGLRRPPLQQPSRRCSGSYRSASAATPACAGSVPGLSRKA